MPTHQQISQSRAQKKGEGSTSPSELARLAGNALFPPPRTIYADAYASALENRLLKLAEQVLQQEEEN